MTSKTRVIVLFCVHFFFHWTNTAVSIFYLVSISFYLVFHFSCRILLVISRLPRIDVLRSEVSLFQTQWQQEDGNRAQLCILYFSCYSVIDYYNSVIGLSLIGHNGLHCNENVRVWLWSIMSDRQWCCFYNKRFHVIRLIIIHYQLSPRTLLVICRGKSSNVIGGSGFFLYLL